jgi:hypothetical protein
MKMQCAGRQIELVQHRDDDPDHRRLLRILKRIFAAIEIADHLEHERSLARVSVVAERAGRRVIPIAPGPDAAIRRDADVLRDIRPALLLGVVFPHGFDAREAAILGAIRPPGVVHMHRVDAAGKGERANQILELLDGEFDERLGHNRRGFYGGAVSAPAPSIPPSTSAQRT